MEFSLQHLVTQLIPHAPGIRLSDIVVLLDLIVLRLLTTAHPLPVRPARSAAPIATAAIPARWPTSLV
jgi:hypothetical protein